ncbi:MAG: YebC/PmpR family DNA-binding transcriptional regulator [Nitrospinota bacterium]|nr:YebC/PmpR family DNA-binding transcriptional regulator [Nitrospinota bacterium]MDH5756417.1 YebC/PmpR family DNA-binding transcriptional regulator [Nitrospinota bacterium]
MSGHSKWSTIKHKKAAIDSKRGRIFTKIIKEITVAARLGGGDADANPRLRTAIASAKSVNMPGDNIERAIKKGTGELPGVSYEEISYEGYGTGGVAVLIETMTDNKNRTVAEIRSIFNKAGGALGENGCVSWMFDKKGLIIVSAEGMGEDALMEIILEAGAEDMTLDGDVFEIKTSSSDLETVREAMEAKGVKIESAEVTMIPKNTTKLDEESARKMLKLMDNLDDQEDVQKVYANFDIAEEVLEKIGG